MGDKETRFHYNFIDYLRVTGMIFVAWPHLTANLNPVWGPLSFIQWLINRPLHITQNFGALGVSIFFLISGFLASTPSRRTLKSPTSYFFYKLTRLIIPLWGAMFFFFLFVKLFELLFNYSSWWSQFSVLDWVKSATLYPHFTGSIDLVNGALWYLVPLILFFLLETLYRFYGSEPSIKFVIFTLSVLGFCFALHDFLPDALCSKLPYIPIILWGYLFNLKSQNRPSLIYITYILCYFVMLFGFYQFAPQFYQDEPYPLSAIFALVLFKGFLLVPTAALRPPKVIQFLSSVSYSFYIVHSLYGGFVISAFFEIIPYGFAVAGGIILSIVVANINYKLFERPTVQWLSHLVERANCTDE